MSKRIAIFSKIGSSGGSEHRCVELANGIVRYSDNSCTILCEQAIQARLQKLLDPRVNVVTNVFKPAEEANPEAVYGYDTLLVVNTDSYSFPKLAYWHGETTHHKFKIDLARIPQMVFLFNFVISPAQWLETLRKKCKDLRIITANREFLSELRYKDKFRRVRKLPTICLESPIDPERTKQLKTTSQHIRIGKHSKAYHYKHNEGWPDLISTVNTQCEDRVAWDFMGVPKDSAEEIADIPNVTIRPEYSVNVGQYLAGVDIFCFFIAWHRREPWARSVAEAIMTGCPVVATDKAGNREQVMDGANGYLCRTNEQFAERLVYLIKNPAVLQRMKETSLAVAQNFTTKAVAERFLEFIA